MDGLSAREYAELYLDADVCVCTHAHDEHVSGSCLAIVEVHERPILCACTAFEAAEVSTIEAGAYGE